MTSQDIYLAAAEIRDAISQASADINKLLMALDQSVVYLAERVSDVGTELYKMRTKKEGDAS